MSHSQAPVMNWSGENLTENLRLFKDKMNLYFLDEEITDASKQARKILRSIGDEGLRKLYGSALTEEDKKDPAKLYSFLEDQLPATTVNFRVHRLQLMRFTINPGESIDAFVTRVRTHGQKCEFTEEELQERTMEIVIASTDNEEFRKELLAKEKGYTIKQLLETGRKYEAIEHSRMQLQKLTLPTTSVDAIKNMKTKQQPCSYCGTYHKKRNCPAYNSTCEACGMKGHWKVVCRNKTKIRAREHDKPARRKERSKSRPRQRDRSESRHQVEMVTDDPESETIFDTIQVEVCEISDSRREVFTTLRIKPPKTTDDKLKIKLKIDTGASGNTLPMRTLKQMYETEEQIQSILTQESVRLMAYNGKPIRYCGTTHMRLCNNNKWFDTKFYVIEVEDYRAPPILGLQSCEEMNLITVHTSDIISVKQPDSIVPKQIQDIETLKSLYPNQFDAIGNFDGKVTLSLQDNAQPFIAAPRKCSIHMRDRIKKELDDMEEKGIIRKVNEHSDWCSNVCFVTKKDGSLRVCLDPKRLNLNLKRCPHKIPTVEELNPTFHGARYFSKLDAKSGYWSVKLSEESQLLTTFRSPLGQRYCFLRMPFGLNTAQDDFQRKMDEILENLEGVVGIADDVCVTGKTEEEHDKNLIRLMERAQEKGLVFNSKKCMIKRDSIAFFGNTYTRNGITPDPAKVEDIRNMPSPTSKDELRRFLGMITYLSQFVPNFSDKSALLRDLLKQDVPWIWEEAHETAYTQLKNAISQESSLSYFDTEKDITLEVDASQKGLGTAVIQDNKPVAFGSKSLTDTQSRYSNIEREMLAIVFGCERHHTLLYGKSFTVVTDHKPLITICKKPIHSAPLRLQRMLLRVQGYNFDIVYRPGSEMVLADALSRLPNREQCKDIDLDIRVDCININIDTVELRNIGLINFSEDKQSQLIMETSRDRTLNALKEYVYNGWPENIKELPTELRAYWPYRDELAIEGGVMFKGKQVLIPQPLRQSILEKLHLSHTGIEKTRQLARESCYWPNINKDIEQMCKMCDLCQEYQHENQREPMIPYPIPSRKWQMIATDLFEISGRQFLIICDKFSKFPLVDEIQSPTSSEAIANKFRHYCALFGKPQEIYSDNGPQYSGQAFQQFCKAWGIKHITSSPTHSRSNGFIERQIGYLKPLLEKSIRNNQDIQLTLLNVRATPVNSKLRSPAELLLGDPIATLLPSHSTVGDEEIRDELYRAQEKMINHDAQSTRKTVLPPLITGQKVRVLSHRNHRWFPGTVISVDKAPRSYMISTNGRNIRRNRCHLRETTSRNESPERAPTLDLQTAAKPPTPETKAAETKKVTFTQPSPHKPKPCEPPCEPPNAETPATSPAKSSLAKSRITRYGRIVKPNPKYTS